MLPTPKLFGLIGLLICADTAVFTLVLEKYYLERVSQLKEQYTKSLLLCGALLESFIIRNVSFAAVSK